MSPRKATRARAARAPRKETQLVLPRDTDTVEVRLGARAVRLTNLRKPFWPELGIAKRDLLQYYADVAPALLPHLRDRAMVMKRYPNGAAGEFFFMKRAPSPRPDWIELCSIEHESGNVIDFPMIQDLPALLWVVNLGCIDLNQWYARCDDVDRPDYVHFDLDPVKGTPEVPFERVRETALVVRDGLEALGMPALAKTTGSRGPATRDYHPSRRRSTAKKPSRGRAASSFTIPRDTDDVVVEAGGREVKLTNVNKPFWPELGITKGDLLQYYADVSQWLIPHLTDRAMVMKRYPHGAAGEFFFMKRAPSPRPEWIELCSIEHGSGNVIDFPIVQDLPALLWVVNLGCIDLNQWYARCDDVDRPDYLHFDLDPVPGADFGRVLETALLVRESLDSLGMPTYAKTTGSKGVHVYVPIVRGPTQKQVWTFAKEFARQMEARKPELVTAEYKVAKRPKGRVLVDYNQNAWGRTLASIYSVRPKPKASVSTPVTWKEIERGVAIEDFRIDNVPARLKKLGDLWEPLLAKSGRFRLEKFL